MTDMRAESLGREIAALRGLAAGAHQADHIFLREWKLNINYVELACFCTVQPSRITLPF